MLIGGWALINFFHFLGGRLFEVGANSRLGAKSNKYGTFMVSFSLIPQHYLPIKFFISTRGENQVNILFRVFAK